jgi:hypothetical protein
MIVTRRQAQCALRGVSSALDTDRNRIQSNPVSPRLYVLSVVSRNPSVPQSAIKAVSRALDIRNQSYVPQWAILRMTSSSEVRPSTAFCTPTAKQEG